MLFGLSDEDIAKMTAVFQRFPEINTVMIYGSRAKGNYRRGSDIDLTLEDNISLSILHQLNDRLDDLLLPYEIDLSVKSHIQNDGLLEHIERVGRVFWSRGSERKGEKGSGLFHNDQRCHLLFLRHFLI